VAISTVFLLPAFFLIQWITINIEQSNWIKNFFEGLFLRLDWLSLSGIKASFRRIFEAWTCGEIGGLSKYGTSLFQKNPFIESNGAENGLPSLVQHSLSVRLSLQKSKIEIPRDHQRNLNWFPYFFAKIQEISFLSFGTFLFTFLLSPRKSSLLNTCLPEIPVSLFCFC